MIKVSCRCGKKYQVSDEHLGSTFSCRACGAKSVVSHSIETIVKPPPTTDPLVQGTTATTREATTVAQPADLDPVALSEKGRARRPWRWLLLASVLTGSVICFAVWGGYFKVVAEKMRPPAKGNVPGPGRYDAGGIPLRSIALSPDGRRLVTGGGDLEDGRILLWDVSEMRVIAKSPPLKAAINCVTFSPNATRILTASGGTVIKDGTASVRVDEDVIQSWDSNTIQLVRRYAGHKGDVTAVAIAEGGRTLLSGGWDAAVRVWDGSSGEEVRNFKHSYPVYSLAVSPDGSRVASGSMDGTLIGWYVRSGREIHRLSGHTLCVNAVAFSPDEQRVLSGGNDTTLRLWNSQTGAEIRSFKGHTAWINCVAFSPDGKRVASGSGGEFVDGKVVEEDDNSVCLWDAESGNLIKRFLGHTARVTGVVFTTDGSRIISCSRDGSVRIWGTARE